MILLMFGYTVTQYTPVKHAVNMILLMFGYTVTQYTPVKDAVNPVYSYFITF